MPSSELVSQETLEFGNWDQPASPQLDRPEAALADQLVNGVVADIKVRGRFARRDG
jgi:hypothetical protein